MNLSPDSLQLRKEHARAVGRCAEVSLPVHPIAAGGMPLRHIEGLGGQRAYGHDVRHHTGLRSLSVQKIACQRGIANQQSACSEGLPILGHAGVTHIVKRVDNSRHEPDCCLRCIPLCVTPGSSSETNCQRKRHERADGLRPTRPLCFRHAHRPPFDPKKAVLGGGRRKHRCEVLIGAQHPSRHDLQIDWCTTDLASTSARHRPAGADVFLVLRLPLQDLAALRAHEAAPGRVPHVLGSAHLDRLQFHQRLMRLGGRRRGEELLAGNARGHLGLRLWRSPV